MARGVNGQSVFGDDSDRRMFLVILRDACAEAASSLLAYCLMGNHFHLALKVRRVPLSAVVQKLLTKYACAYNARHEREGHLFQARYKAIVCADDLYLRRLVRYIHENPVRGGLVSCAREWPWSSVVEWNSKSGVCLVDRAEVAALAVVESDSGEAPFDAWPRQAITTALLRTDEPEIIPIARLAAKIAASAGVPVEGLKSASRLRELSKARGELARVAVRSGHSLRSVARFLRRHDSSVHQLIYGRITETTEGLTP